VRGLRSLAAAGNALALVLLVLVLARRDVLLGNRASPPPAIRTAATAPASRVLVVVIDALRTDRIDRMPQLSALAHSGGRGTARIEALVPSTVAGIRALAEGVPPPPALAAGLAIWSAVAAGTEPPRAGFFVNAALWPALALAFVAPGAAVWLAVVVLVAVALDLTPRPPLPSHTQPPGEGAPPPEDPHPRPLL
jgi:hypothetical protein